MALRDTSWIWVAPGSMQTSNAVIDRVETNRIKKSVTQGADTNSAQTLTGYKDQTITYYRWIGLTFDAMNNFMTDTDKGRNQDRDIRSFTADKTSQILNSWDVTMKQTTLVKGQGWSYVWDTETIS